MKTTITVLFKVDPKTGFQPEFQVSLRDLQQQGFISADNFCEQ